MTRDNESWRRVADLFEHDVDDRLRIVVSVNENVDGRRLIDVRQFWRGGGGGDWLPSRKGIAMPVDEWWTVVAVIQAWLDDNG